MRISDLEADETVDGTAARIQKIIAQGEERFEARHRRKDGSVFDVDVSAQHRPIKGGRLVAFFRDIIESRPKTPPSMAPIAPFARALSAGTM